MADGECHVNFDDQAACDAECAGNSTCEPGKIEARCEPGSITSICDGSCLAGAWCVGSAKVSANCEGKCESMCEGKCEGKCYGNDGSVTENAACHGKCEARCIGSCSGACEVEASASIACGAGVYCRGTCDGIMDSPACTTEFDKPQCDVDIACYEACTARLNGRVQDIDGKSLACVGTAATQLSDAVDVITVSVNASLDIQTEVNVRAEETPGDGSEPGPATGDGV